MLISLLEIISIISCLLTAGPLGSREARQGALRTTPFIVLYELIDSCSAGFKAFRLRAHASPGIWHYVQRCDSHQSNLITSRPFMEIIPSLYCLSKLQRLKVEAKFQILIWQESNCTCVSSLTVRGRPGQCQNAAFVLGNKQVC